MAPIRLEIHHINVRGGDATAIIVKDNGAIVYSVLIDAGAEGSGVGILTEYLQKFIFPTTPLSTSSTSSTSSSSASSSSATPPAAAFAFDLIVASHYHNDHMDGFRKAGIRF